MNVVVLCGGTGGAKLACGLAAAMDADALTVVANTADDDEFWTLRVSPDIDAVLYRLSRRYDDERGFGIRDDTFNVLAGLRELSEPAWFQLGDRDIALQLARERLRRDGASLSEAVDELRRRLQIRCAVVPMSEEPVRTRVHTDQGELSLQEWFVRERGEPRVRGLSFAGAERAAPAPAAVRALEAADVVILGPSNPLISIDPMLRVLGRHLQRERTIAVTPLVSGRSLKGPTDRMLRMLGLEVSATAVAGHYRDAAGTFVLDAQDRELTSAVAALGMRVLVLDTVMPDAGGERRVARALLEAWRRRRA